jgi:hypothetical protein
MKFVDEWGSVYNTCVVEFTGRNGAIATSVPQLKAVVENSGPLLTVLGALDNALPEKPSPGSVKDFDKKYKVWCTEQTKLNSVANSYNVFVKAALVALKAREAEFPSAYRAVKVLAKSMNDIVFRAQKQTATLSSEVQKASAKIDAKVEKEQEKLRKQGMLDDAIKVELNWLRQQKMLMQFPTSFRAAHAKAEAIVQKIKLKPTKETYDKEMAGARDMTQNMSNVIKLLADAKCPDDLKQAVNGIAAHKPQLDAFGNGPKKTVGADKTKDQILAQLKEFSTLIKAMSPFAESLGRYLAGKKF